VIVNLVQRTLRRFGVELRRTNAPDESFAAQRRLTTATHPVIFDVGAHHGHVALRYRRMFPGSRVHCFEPFPPSFAQLQARVGHDPAVELHALALSSASGHAQLNANAVSDTNSLLPSDPRTQEFWGKGMFERVEQVDVQTVTLDEFCARERIERIDILKIDVQGHEFAVLDGARRMLGERRIGLLYFELIVAPNYVGQRPPRDYFDLLEASGYELIDLFNPIRRLHRLVQADVLFTPRATDPAASSASSAASRPGS
jgi:FkbM family methyltransferase